MTYEEMERLTDGAFDAVVLDVLRCYGTTESGLHRFVTALRISRDMQDGRRNFPMGTFSRVCDAVERLYVAELVRRRLVNDDLYAYAFVSILDAIALAAVEDGDE